jgi:hypothetical protein
LARRLGGGGLKVVWGVAVFLGTQFSSISPGQRPGLMEGRDSFSAPPLFELPEFSVQIHRRRVIREGDNGDLK